MELRIVHDPDESGDLLLEGVKLGEPGDEGNGPVLLAQLELDATVGSDAFEVTNSNDAVATVNGRNYVVGLATVRTRTGRTDDRLVFFGYPTEYTPGDNDAAADAQAVDKAERKARKAEDTTDRPSRRK